MIFSSIIFLFLFLPLVLSLTFLSNKRYHNHILLGASLIFYFWGEAFFTLLLLGSIVVNFYLAKAIQKSRGRRQHVLLGFGVCCNLLPLFICKYLHFVMGALQPLFLLFGNSPLQGEAIHLPAGISFFTFQAISYLIDVYRKIAPAEQKILNCALYIAMFPQLIAGPIVRYHDIARQFVQRTLSVRKFAEGAERFVFGLGKKVLIADPLGVQADLLFQMPLQELSTGNAWLGAICFSLQIYYDFSGYSDMAIGLGKMFGFRLPENFNYPYISRSMREFWRRWHISLSTWLRDYLYIPLGGSRDSKNRTMANLLIVFLLCGLWHGANWTFLVWGLWHGLFLIIERIIPPSKNTLIRQGLGWCYTFLVVIIGWVIFRSPTLDAAYQYLWIMAGNSSTGNELFFTTLMADCKLQAELIGGFLIALPCYTFLKQKGKQIQEGRFPGPAKYAAHAVSDAAKFVLFGATFYFTLITIASQAYHPFLYFQF